MKKTWYYSPGIFILTGHHLQHWEVPGILLENSHHQYHPYMNPISYNNDLHGKLWPFVQQCHKYESNQQLFVIGLKNYSII